jgi:hypothetical protein
MPPLHTHIMPLFRCLCDGLHCDCRKHEESFIENLLSFFRSMEIIDLAAIYSHFLPEFFTTKTLLLFLAVVSKLGLIKET